jgi:hypothetical protein
VVLGLSADRRPDSMQLVSDARPMGRASLLDQTIRCSPCGLRCGVELGARQQVESASSWLAYGEDGELAGAAEPAGRLWRNRIDCDSWC